MCSRINLLLRRQNRNWRFGFSVNSAINDNSVSLTPSNHDTTVPVVVAAVSKNEMTRDTSFREVHLTWNRSVSALHSVAVRNSGCRPTSRIARHSHPAPDAKSGIEQAIRCGHWHGFRSSEIKEPVKLDANITLLSYAGFQAPSGKFLGKDCLKRQHSARALQSGRAKMLPEWKNPRPIRPAAKYDGFLMIGVTSTLISSLTMPSSAVVASRLKAPVRPENQHQNHRNIYTTDSPVKSIGKGTKREPRSKSNCAARCQSSSLARREFLCQTSDRLSPTSRMTIALRVVERRFGLIRAVQESGVSYLAGAAAR